MARFYEADCRRKGRLWLIKVSGWSPQEGDFNVGATRARVFRREIEPMARDLIGVETGETDVKLYVSDDDLIPAVYRRRWQWHWPWMISRPWLPGAGRGSDEFCNRSVMITLPLLGMLVVFYRPGRLRTAQAFRCRAGTPTSCGPFAQPDRRLRR